MMASTVLNIHNAKKGVDFPIILNAVKERILIPTPSPSNRLIDLFVMHISVLLLQILVN